MVPVYILSGFLGSGKTTLLTEAVAYMKQQGYKPAVVMNELGEVNLDGLAVGSQVPMAELLDGCICCSIKGELGIAIQQLIQKESPDVVLIEATGAANPMEIVDGVTEASLYMKVELKNVITIVDAAQLFVQLQKGAGKTYRLMQEQIRCAGTLILNKLDLVKHEELAQLESTLREWNPMAQRIIANYAKVEPELLWFTEENHYRGGDKQTSCGPDCREHGHEHEEGHHVHHKHHHHSHSHVMVYTRYLSGPVDSHEFEALVRQLPESVYRAKGVLTFKDTASRYLFQYAYRQPDYMRIEPQAQVPDVVVFIGEGIPKEQLEELVTQLESR